MLRYKPIGTLSGVVKDKKDGFENIKVRDENALLV
jgi:hypothetical protein